MLKDIEELKKQIEYSLNAVEDCEAVIDGEYLFQLLKVLDYAEKKLKEDNNGNEL